MSEARPCLICTAPAKYAHCGVDSCRSCAEFFKRTVSAGRIFICRKGDGQCIINPKDRHNCKGCRFERCKRSGMKVSEELSLSCSQEFLPDVIPSRDPIGERSKSADLQTARAGQDVTGQDETIEQIRSKFGNTDDLIARLVSEFRKSVERRRVAELELRESVLKRHVKADFPGEEFLLCSWSYLVECLKLFASDHMIFAKRCFPEFAKLSQDDQSLMLKHFAARLYMAEKQCNTFKMFGTHDGPFDMATLTTVFDTRQHQFFTEEEVPSSSKDIVSVMDHYTERIKHIVGPIHAKAQFTETEYVVIFALCIWHIDPSEPLNDRIIDISNTMRKKLFNALRTYYSEELGLDDYSVRMGNLLTYEHAIQELTTLLNEEVQAYTLTGLLDEDVQFFQEVLTIPLNDKPTTSNCDDHTLK